MTAKKNPSEISLRQRALNLLGRREYSRVELARRLSAYSDDSDEIASLMADFEQRGWLSDQRFAEQLVHRRGTQFGVRRISQELRDKGLDHQTIEAVLEQHGLDDTEVARQVWLRKFGTPPQTPQEKARQIRFLQSRGFGLGSIFKVIAGQSNADEDVWGECE